MRSKFALILSAICLACCSGTPEPLSYRTQLDTYKDMKIRLYRVGVPVQKSGAKICTRTQITDGAFKHSLPDYPEHMREIAKSHWALTNKKTKLVDLPIEGSICASNLVLSYDEKYNAWTDGSDIFITSALVREVDDLALALIIAHELGHMSLGHIHQEQSEKLERQADRFALFMLARAGLDYKKAAAQDNASRQPHLSKDPTFTDPDERAEHFRKVVIEIEKLEAAGKPLVP